jgi:hypothetical protein
MKLIFLNGLLQTEEMDFILDDSGMLEFITPLHASKMGHTIRVIDTVAQSNSQTFIVHEPIKGFKIKY